MKPAYYELKPKTARQHYNSQPFATQKATFHNAKGHLSKHERHPFAYALTINALHSPRTLRAKL